MLTQDTASQVPLLLNTSDFGGPMDPLNTQDLTEARFIKRQARAANLDGWGSTDGGLAVAQRYLIDAIEVVKEKRSEQIIGRTKEILELSNEILGFLCIKTAISSLCAEDVMSQTMLSLGRAVSNECYGLAMEAWDKNKAQGLVSTAFVNNGRVRARMKSLKKKARQAGFKYDEWTSAEHLKAGKWLFEVCINLPCFVFENDKLSMTEEALEVSDVIIAQLIRKYPCHLPSKVKPEPWTKYKQKTAGYHTNLVRRNDPDIQAHIRSHIKDGSMHRVLNAVNSSQSVGFLVNTRIMVVIEQCVLQDIIVPGLPPRHDIVLPEFIGDPVDKQEEIVRWQKISAVKQRNKGYIGERLTYKTDIETAKWLGNDVFYIPMNMDYRGRVYGIPNFNFQRGDYVRSLFLFEHGEVLDAEGIYWLKVHLANCGAFDKIDKAPLEERVSWVDQHLNDICEYALTPMDNLGWTQADSPFMFLAACMALTDALMFPEQPCNLPVSFDGSCSGLQHLCAMTRAEEGSLVNLTPSPRPQDVYTIVAEKALGRIRKAVGGDDDELATRVLAYGVTRSLVKRNVMTYSYSSTKYGMADQQIEDTMRPLRLKVMSGEIAEHPFGPDNGMLASRFLAKHIYDAIVETVALPAKAMEFLQECARSLGSVNLPTTWTTPIGFPVLLKCPKYETNRVKLILNDKGIKREFKPNLQIDTVGIDKRKAASSVAPGFVHSMDACHLMLVVEQSVSEGIDQLVLVHDSFGCLPSKAGRFRDIIRSTFAQMYTDHDVLLDIQRNTLAQMTTPGYTVPELPTYGSLDINLIKDSDYAFS